jgi:dephospho-CoA kinase
MKLLAITGSMGSGKTTMMGEVSDVLASRDVAHAAIDLDAFGHVHDPSGIVDRAAVTYRNVADAVSNYIAEGVTTLVTAGAIESRADLGRLREAAAATEVTVCRLVAPVAIMHERIRMREPGMWQQKYVDHVAILEDVLDRAGVEDFSIANDGTRPITEVAREILQRSGWMRL